MQGRETNSHRLLLSWTGVLRRALTTVVILSTWYFQKARIMCSCSTKRGRSNKPQRNTTHIRSSTHASSSTSKTRPRANRVIPILRHAVSQSESRHEVHVTITTHLTLSERPANQTSAPRPQNPLNSNLSRALVRFQPFFTLGLCDFCLRPLETPFLLGSPIRLCLFVIHLSHTTSRTSSSTATSRTPQPQSPKQRPLSKSIQLYPT